MMNRSPRFLAPEDIQAYQRSAKRSWVAYWIAFFCVPWFCARGWQGRCVRLAADGSDCNMADGDCISGRVDVKSLPMNGLILSFLLCVGGVSHAQDLCQIISGASVIADDGKFLGKLTSQYSSDSILNEYGTHGSQYSSDSIWNQYGTYGSAYSSLSPFNQYTSTPPVLVKSGKVIARLTANKNLRGALTPYVVKSCEFY